MTRSKKLNKKVNRTVKVKLKGIDINNLKFDELDIDFNNIVEDTLTDIIHHIDKELLNVAKDTEFKIIGAFDNNKEDDTDDNMQKIRKDK